MTQAKTTQAKQPRAIAKTVPVVRPKPAAPPVPARPSAFPAAFGLFALYSGLLFWSAGSLGYARDEGFYFQAANAYRGWFELLLAEPMAALQRPVIDRFWSVNHEHPALMKTLFMASHALFHDKLGWIREPGTAYRLPSMLLAGLGVALIYVWGRRVHGAAAGLVAAVSFAAMPRVFFHAHLACFDVPVSVMWLLTLYCYARSLAVRTRGWYLATGLSYGLLLETKHNAWLLPGVLAAHQLLLLLGDAIASRRKARPLLPRAWIAMALLGPALFYVLWPWLWYAPLERFIEYFQFHAHHEYYNMEFLGQTYWKPPMPLGYAWLMTFGTVPLVTLLLFGLGLVHWLSGARAATHESSAALNDELGRSAPGLLWVLAVIVSYAPWLYEQTPIFGGTKHWLTAYPLLCLLAGRGFHWLLEQLRAAGFAPQRDRLRACSVGACLLAGPIAMTVHSHPFGLTFYTPLVGGAPGAATLGLNRGFWGYTTGSLTNAINRDAASNASIYVHDTALQSFDMLRLDGRLREDLRPTLAIQQSSMALYHHEQHMARVEYQIWVEYGTLVPTTIVCYDGVPVVWMYERP